MFFLLVFSESQEVHKSYGAGIHPLQQIASSPPSAKDIYGEFTQANRQIPSLTFVHLWVFHCSFSSCPQPQTKSLFWLVTWTTFTTRSCVLPFLTSTSWPTFFDSWTSRWFPCSTSTGRRCTALLLSSCCCSTKASTVHLLHTSVRFERLYGALLIK